MKVGDLELEEKAGRIFELLEGEKLAGVLLNAQHNFAWLTGGRSNGIDLSRENGAATVLLTAAGKRYLLANNIEMPRLVAEQILPEADFELVEFSWQRERSDPGLLFDTARALAGGGVACDLPVDSRAPVIESLIAKCRYRPTPGEVERIRLLGNEAGAAMDSLVGKIGPGQSELEIAEKLRQELAGGGMVSVVTLVAADERIRRYRHPVPADGRWEKLLLLVACAKRAGLIVSLSRMICAGSVADDVQRRTEAAAFVNASLWNATLPGTTGADLFRVASEAYRERGFADEIDKHHQGGAAGYRTREWLAHPTSGEIVHADQAFAWNPSITGTKIEETVVVTVDGVETITTSPSFPSIETSVGGRSYFSPGILYL